MAAFALGIGAFVLASPPIAAAPRFETSVYLYNQAYDADMTGPAGKGTGNWAKYKAWLGAKSLGAEADPGWGPGDWCDCAQHVNWNLPWAAQQQRKGASLPTVMRGMGQMPSDPNSNHSWDQKMAWENATWKAEANNDPTIMGYFANYAKEVNSLGFKKVVIRLGYEFDGGWNPFGNLNVMSNMPNNHIAAWRNIVTTMRPGRIKSFLASMSSPTWHAHHKPLVVGEWGLWQLNDASHPSGGDNTTYIQRMYDWMNDPYNNVAIACYFEAPADGNSSLSGIFGPTTFPKSAALYKKLFGADYTSVPDVPLNLKTTLGGNQLSLSWNSSDRTATYNVYRGTRAGGESSTPIATDLVGTSYVDTGLTNGTRYYYKVKAVNSKGLSAYSNEAGAAPSAAFIRVRPRTQMLSSKLPAHRIVFATDYGETPRAQAPPIELSNRAKVIWCASVTCFLQGCKL